MWICNNPLPGDRLAAQRDLRYGAVAKRPTREIDSAGLPGGTINGRVDEPERRLSVRGERADCGETYKNETCSQPMNRHIDQSLEQNHNIMFSVTQAFLL